MLSQIQQKIKHRYILHRYLQPFCRKQLLNRSYSPQNTIALFAQHRSGSTWVAEILNHIQNSIILNEPLWRGHFKANGLPPEKDEGRLDEVRLLNFFYYQPIPESAEWPEAEAFFDKLFRGGICKLGLHSMNKPAELHNAKVFIIKFCSAHLLFHWLISKFQIQPLVLLRHPCAVVASQLNHISWEEWKKAPAFRPSHFRYHEYFLQYQDMLKNIHTPEGILAAIWAINNKAIDDSHLHSKDWYTIVYEKLYQYPQEELRNLFSWMQLPLPASTLAFIKKPSINTNEKSKEILQDKDPSKHLARWKQELNKRQISNIMHVIADFGIDYYSADSLEPDYSKL